MIVIEKLGHLRAIWPEGSLKMERSNKQARVDTAILEHYIRSDVGSSDELDDSLIADAKPSAASSSFDNDIKPSSRKRPARQRTPLIENNPRRA